MDDTNKDQTSPSKSVLEVSGKCPDRHFFLGVFFLVPPLSSPFLSSLALSSLLSLFMSEVIQEGWFYLPLENQSLVEYEYQINSEGLLAFRSSLPQQRPSYGLGLGIGIERETGAKDRTQQEIGQGTGSSGSEELPNGTGQGPGSPSPSRGSNNNSQRNTYKVQIQILKFRLFDCTSLLPSGWGLSVRFHDKEFFLVFDHILDLKRFCFGCYRMSDGKNILSVMSKMGWAQELADLKLEPENKRSIKSSLSYLQSFVKVSLDSSEQGSDGPKRSLFKSEFLQSWASTDKDALESPEIRRFTPGAIDFDYAKIFRRLSSLNSDRCVNEKNLVSSKSNETISPAPSSELPGLVSSSVLTIEEPSSRTHPLTPLFISSVLCLLDPKKRQKATIPNGKNVFSNGVVQLFPSGTLIVNYEKLVNPEEALLNPQDDSQFADDHILSQKCSEQYTCRKVLCSKYQPPLSNLDDEQISNIALQLRIYSTLYYEPSFDPDQQTLYRRRKIGQQSAANETDTTLVLIFPSLLTAKSFLTALSNVVPIHNIIGFLLDMSWVSLETEKDSSFGDSIDMANTTEESVDNTINDRLFVDISIPETIKEEESFAETKQEVLISEEEEVKESEPKDKMNSFGSRLKKLYSGESYSGLENSETSDMETGSPENQIQSPGAPVQRRSRLSRLFGMDFSRKESSDTNEANTISNRFTRVKNALFNDGTTDSNKSIIVDDDEGFQDKFPGFKYRSNSHVLTNESNLSIIDEMDDIPPQQLTQGRFTTLKQLIGPITEANSGPDLSQIKGIKGTRNELMSNTSTSYPHSTNNVRSRERAFDGIGAMIGGVLFDKLVIRKIEFTPRYLELKLQEISPISKKSAVDNFLPTITLHSNKLITPKELASSFSGHVTYDGHLILDGVDISRDKHVEIIIRILDLSIEKSIELLHSWLEKRSASDIPDHWEGFVTQSLTAFSQKVREAKEQSFEPRVIISNSVDECVESLAVTIPPLWTNPPENPKKSPPDSARSKSSKDGQASIQHLDLRYCQMTNRGVTILVDCLRHNYSLISLNLTGNLITRDSTAASLGNMLNFNSTLLEMNLQETCLGNTGATLVAQALHINNTLEKLSLSGNKIGPLGCAMICMALEENETLIHLNLSRNIIGVEGTKWIAKSLYTNKTLRYLDLNRQQLKGKIGSDGAKYLSRCLRMNNTLHILRIGRNRIGFEGARFLSGMILINRGLRVLDISHSKIGVEGSIQLANSLIQNNTLQTILLANRLLPVCYLKGVHDSDYFKREPKTRFTMPNEGSPQTVQSPNQSHSDSPLSNTGSTDSGLLYHLDDDIYRANDPGELNCDIAYECNEKTFDRIDLQVLFASNVPSQLYNNIEDWTTEAISKSFGNSHSTQTGPNLSDSVVDLEEGLDNRHSTTRIIRPLAVTDEESVLIAHLIRGNNLLHELRLEHTYLPIQLLRGRSLNSRTTQNQNHPSIITPVNGSTQMYSLDLSNSNLVSSDATVIGVLIAENPFLRTVCLKGNYFNKTDGETWIANAINKNPRLCLDTNLWSAEEMFADGYHQLAALKGVSVSGAAIEPQRLDTFWDKALVFLSGVGYYLDVASDIYVTYLYSLSPELVYFVPWSALIISFPTFMTIGSILWTTILKHPCRGLLQILIVIFQLHPIWHVSESILMGIETTALLDSKFLEGIYEAIPQILLQTYIMFLVSVSTGGFQLPIFISLLISMFSVSGVLVMLVDRGKVRQVTLGPRRKNPWFVRYLAHVLAVLFEGETLMKQKHGRSHEGMKDLIHYSSYTYSHYTWAVLLHFSTLAVRLIALTWLLAVVDSYKFVVFIIVFSSRALLLFFLDPRTKRRSTFRSLVWCLCYCLITGVWDKDERSPVASRRAYLILNILDTIESAVFVSYAGFLSKNSHMRTIHGLLTFAAVVICRAISWTLIISWQLPVHYSELQTDDKLKTSCYDLAIFRLCSTDTHTFIDDVVTRVETPVIPLPRESQLSNSLNSPDKRKTNRPKSWWSSEERSATMELSYLSAVVDSKLTLFSSPQGVTVQQSSPSPSPISTPRDPSEDSFEHDPQNNESSSITGRDRSQARDWDAMPEVIRQKKGRFQLKGGKNMYTDEDLVKNMEQRHHALSHKSRRGFSGWNRHIVPFHNVHQECTTTSSDVDDEGLGAVNLAEYKQRFSQIQQEFKEQPTIDNPRRGTAQVDYHDFIPSKARQTEKLRLTPVSDDMNESKEYTDTTVSNQLDLTSINPSEVNQDQEDMIWEINPTRSFA